MIKSNKEEFEKQMEVITVMLSEQKADGVEQKQWQGFIHIATTLMREAFADGMSGSGVPDMVAKLRSLNNPLALATASAVMWSFEQGVEARG